MKPHKWKQLWASWGCGWRWRGDGGGSLAGERRFRGNAGSQSQIRLKWGDMKETLTGKIALWLWLKELAGEGERIKTHCLCRKDLAYKISCSLILFPGRDISGTMVKTCFQLRSECDATLDCIPKKKKKSKQMAEFLGLQCHHTVLVLICCCCWWWWQWWPWCFYSLGLMSSHGASLHRGIYIYKKKKNIYIYI